MTALGMWLTLYALHALWQLPLLWAAGMLMRRTLRQARPILHYRLWVAVLCAQLLIPAISASGLSWRAALRMMRGWSLGSDGSGHAGQVTAMSGPLLAHGGWTMPTQIWIPLFCAFAIFTAVFAFRLGRSYWCLRALAKEATEESLASDCTVEWQACCRQFGLAGVRLLETTHPLGIVTVGWRRKALIAPAGLLQRLSRQDRLAAYAHECAHMRRNDFAWNFAFHLVALPLRFHPVLQQTLRRIVEAREMVCDELAAEAVAGRRTYLQCLLRLASQLLAVTPTGNLSVVAMLDANLLERRLMRLEQKTNFLRRPAIIAVALTSFVSLAGTWATASALQLAVASPGTTAAKAATTPTQVSGGVEAGNLLTSVHPVYPQEARDARISGSVVLKAVIDETGKISHLEVLSGPAELTKSALDAVSQWTYTPYMMNGQPTAVDTTITINYNLK